LYACWNATPISWASFLGHADAQPLLADVARDAQIDAAGLRGGCMRVTHER